MCLCVNDVCMSSVFVCSICMSTWYIFKDEELNRVYFIKRVLLLMNCQVNLESLCPPPFYFLKSRWNIFKPELVGTLLKTVHQIIPCGFL